MQRFVITGREAGWRFDKYLKKLLPQASSGFLYKMLRKKNITLNQKKAAGNEVIARGDTVEVFFSEETYRKFSGNLPEVSEQEEAGRKREEEEEKNIEAAADGKISEAKTYQSYRRAYQKLKGISVIYEDENILVLNKPAGILSQKADKEDFSLNEWMIGYLLEKKEITEEELARFRPSVCNRLDRNTSGLMLCGKSVRGSQFLSEILRDRSVHKYYVTYVQGRVGQKAVLDGYLKKKEENNSSAIIDTFAYRQLILAEPEAEKEYKRIETVIKPLFYVEGKDCTKLEILLVTGKSHQIRAHLAGTGHPVLGDRKYGWRPAGKEEAVLKHQLLHACRVEFPVTEGEFAYLSGKCLTAPAPESWGVWLSF